MSCLRNKPCLIVFYWMFTIFTSFLLLGCGSSDEGGESVNDDIQEVSRDERIRPPTDDELASIELMWEARDLTPSDIEIVLEEEHERFTIYIVKHLLQGREHYGSVLVPKSDSPETLPIMLMPDGLDQSRPVLDMDQFIIWNMSEGTMTEGFIQIYPGFRGRSVTYNGKAYHSPGDFCDAYDGATDDTMAFLSAALALDFGGNVSKILAVGISRGGNTAFQLALRDPRITTVIAMAGPVDFNRESVRQRYGSQYQCQFINGKDAEQSRERILASSPLYFSPLDHVEEYFIFQGGVDNVVPQWNSIEMADHLRAHDQQVSLFLYPNDGHGSFWDNEEHIQNYQSALDSFRASLH